MPFNFTDFAKSFGVSIVLTLLFTLLFSSIPGANEFMSDLHPSISFILSYLIQWVIFFFPLWLFLIDKHGLKMKDFGFRKISLLSLLKNVISIYLLYLLLGFSIALLLKLIGGAPGYGMQESYLPLFGNDVWGLGVGLIFVVFIAPFVEEIYFRGFVYKTFAGTWPIWLASILSAALFAFVHFQFQVFIPLFIVGLFLNWSYQKTQSLWVAIAFHALNNAIAFGADIYFYNNPELLNELVQQIGLVYNGISF